MGVRSNRNRRFSAAAVLLAAASDTIVKSSNSSEAGNLAYHLHLNLYKGSVSNGNLLNPLNGYNDDDIRTARNQKVPQPFYKKSGSSYVFNTSYSLSRRDAYWNGSDTAESHKNRYDNRYSRYSTNPIANAYPNIHG